ncbi:TrkH family potassium uptake protein [Inquilinus sp. CAU 1745]|uniref:TrkH family potassium uptake protein n=1 Tax=Inquilinus sp. CAU 1745 TaxID=3140369 RepID=UPI00325B5267
MALTAHSHIAEDGAAYRLDPRPIFYVIGFLMIIFAVAMLIPMAVDLVTGNPDWFAFALSIMVTLFAGGALAFTCYQPKVELTIRQTFVLTTTSWVAIAAVSALPFFFSELDLNLADSYFESMSGLTTTGSTVIVGLDNTPKGILLWRSLLHWLGGIGIIVMGLAILPFLKIGGMQLFHTESSDRSDKVVPSVTDLTLWIGVTYVALTILCFLALRFFGMGAFDAVNHAMATLSTGGFSTSDLSAANWSQPGIHWTLTVFMVLGGLPFVRYVSLLRGNRDALWRDSQVRVFLISLAMVWIVMALWLQRTSDYGFWDALRLVSFNVTSVVTTTGFALTDYSLWGAPAVVAFYLLTFVGGCTGSTAGGIKIFRFEILWITLKNQLVRLYSPHQVLRREYNGKNVRTEVVISVVIFFFVFIAAQFLFALILGMMGLDLVTATTGAATALANVGPGLGDIIGPAGNFSTLPNGAKWVLSLAMLLGRLEFFTVLVMLTPAFWRR